MSEDYVGVRGYRQPSACEQRDLIQRMKAGDMGARETFVRSNMGLVFKIAKNAAPNFIDDAIQEGAIKLWKVAEVYNPARGEFSTLAYISIQRAIRHAVKTESRKQYSMLEDASVNAEFSFIEEEHRNSVCELLRDAVRELPLQERFVVTFHHGLYDEKPMTLRALGKQLKISPEYVRRIEKKALLKIRRRLQQSA